MSSLSVDENMFLTEVMSEAGAAAYGLNMIKCKSLD